MCSIKPLFSPRSGIDLPKRFEREWANERAGASSSAKAAWYFRLAHPINRRNTSTCRLKNLPSYRTSVRPFQSPKRIKISNIFHGYGAAMVAATTAAAAAFVQKFAIIYGAVSARRNFFFQPYRIRITLFYGRVLYRQCGLCFPMFGFDHTRVRSRIRTFSLFELSMLESSSFRANKKYNRS